MQLEMSEFVELYNTIKALENKVASLEARMSQLEERQDVAIERPPFPADKVKGKYAPLGTYLYEHWARKIELSYAEIERILGFSLPASAYKEKLAPSYWANTEYHSYAKGSWLALDYKAKVDVETKTVVFERTL